MGLETGIKLLGQCSKCISHTRPPFAAAPKLATINPSELQICPNFFKGKVGNVVDAAKSNLSFMTGLEKDIGILKEDDLIQFMVNKNKEFAKYINKPEGELLYLIKENKFTEAEREELFKYLEDIKSSLTLYLTKKERVAALNAKKELLDRYGEMGNLARAKFIRVFDDIIFPKSTKPVVIDVEKKLAGLGIDARLTDHEEISQNIYNAYKNMYDKGVREFPKVRYTSDKDAINQAIANKAIQDRYVIYSDDIFNILKEEKGYFANPTIEGVIYHESGHTFNNVGCGATVLGDNSHYEKIAKELSIQQEVSMYAYCLDEGMAETFAGMMGGKIYPEKIVQFYKENKGYIPPLLITK